MTPRNLSKRILIHPVLRAQPDRRLVALAREGHGAAVDEIVRRYRPALKHYAASIVPADRADDVVQDTLARALSGITAGDADIRLRPWLYTITRNTALNALRDAGPPTEQLDENYDGVEQPPQAFERREQVRSLLTSLNDLPEAQRQALVKREMEGMSHAEIGMDLGVSVGAARQLIYRARGALREGIGALVPMPLLRELLESGGTSGIAVAGGGAIAAKTAIAVLATGAALTTGAMIGISHHHASRVVAVQAGDAGPGTSDPSKQSPSMKQLAFAAGQPAGTRTGVNSVQTSNGIGGDSRPPGGGKSTTGDPGQAGGDLHQGTGSGHGTSGNGDGSGEGTSGQGGDSPSGDSGSGDSLSRDNSGGSDSGTQSSVQPSSDGGNSSGNDGSGGSLDESASGDTATTQATQD